MLLVIRKPSAGSWYWPVYEDPTGELNDAVWSHLGHLRHDLMPHDNSHLAINRRHSAVRWPTIRPIPMHKPTLKLNELWWPTLHQHSCDLWIAVPSEVTIDGQRLKLDDLIRERKPDAYKVVIGRMFINTLVLVSAWTLRTIPSTPSDVLATEAYASGVTVLRFGDWRLALREPARGLAHDSSTMTYQMARQAGLVSLSYGGIQHVSSSLDIIPCPNSTAMQDCTFGQWIDSVLIGVGAWPSVTPYNAQVQTLSGLPAALSSSSISAIKEETEGYYHARTCDPPFDRHKGASSAMGSSIGELPTDVQVTWSDPVIRQLEGHVRSDGYITGTTLIGGGAWSDSDSVGDHRTGMTSLYRNYDPDGVYTGPEDARVRQHLDAINRARLQAMTRGSRRVTVGAEDRVQYFWSMTERSHANQWPKRFPPSAFLIREIGVAVSGDNPSVDSAVQLESVEIGWSLSQLPMDFPITWRPQAGGIPASNTPLTPGGNDFLMDAALVGHTLPLWYDESAGYWKDPHGHRIDFVGSYTQFRPVFAGLDVTTGQTSWAVMDEANVFETVPPGGWWTNWGWWGSLPCPSDHDYISVCGKTIESKPAAAVVMRTAKSGDGAYDAYCWRLISGVVYLYYTDGTYPTITTTDPPFTDDVFSPGGGHPPASPDPTPIPLVTP